MTTCCTLATLPSSTKFRLANLTAVYLGGRNFFERNSLKGTAKQCNLEAMSPDLAKLLISR